MSEKKLYAVALNATRPKPGTFGMIENCLMALGVLAVSRDEAVGKGHIYLERECPSGDGWGGYLVSAAELDVNT